MRCRSDRRRTRSRPGASANQPLDRRRPVPAPISMTSQPPGTRAAAAAGISARITSEPVLAAEERGRRLVVATTSSGSDAAIASARTADSTRSGQRASFQPASRAPCRERRRDRRRPARARCRIATASAASEISVATTRAAGHSSASVIAMHPLPVPTSTTTGGRLRSGSGRLACRHGERFLDDELGLRPRNQDVGRDAKRPAVELALAGEVGDRLARGAPRDQRRDGAPRSPAGAFARRDSRASAPSPAEVPAREQRGVAAALALVRGRPRRAAGSPSATPTRSTASACRLRARVELVDESSRSPSSASVELVHREVDAVVGDAVFLEVVGADLLGALAGADLAARVPSRSRPAACASPSRRAASAAPSSPSRGS